VLDPRTGAVLAMASNPSYDPRIFNGGLSVKEARSLDICGDCPPRHNQPLLDRATQGLYPAGSTFKPFVAAAALHEGFAKLNGQYNCPSGWTAPIDPTHHVFHNWSTLDYGYMSLAQALTVSCDTVFYQLGYQFWRAYWRSPERANELMQKDLETMGFGRATGIDLPGEQHGLVPTAEYVRQVFKSNPAVYGKFYGWLPGDAVNLSIGQGFLQVTPLQLATAYAALANGGRLLRPHVVDRIDAPDGSVVRRIQPQEYGRLPVGRRQINYLRNALANVPRTGTAATAFAGFPLDQIPVAGKTGTADVIPQQPYSWFAAMAPADHPRYVVVCMVEQGGHGSTTAAPIVRRILEGLFGLRPAPLRAGSVAD
jgi:penicillin-binding protein 2